MDIPARLKMVRCSLSQTEFAKKIGSSQSTVSGCEKGKQRPDSELIKRICSEFSVNPTWLLFGTGPMYMEGDSGETGDMSPALPTHSQVQLIENITSKRIKTGDMSPVLEIQQKLTEALQRGLAAQERIASLLEERAELQVALERTRMDMERRDQRIRELEKENAQLRESRKGVSPVFRAATGEAN